MLFALVLAPFPASADTTNSDYDYRHSGVGNKYGNDGFEGYDLETGRGKAASTERAGDENKRGDKYRDQAKELNGMSNQIGQDRNNLLPRLQQAKAQDLSNPNASGASRVQTLFQQKYEGPKKYEKAFRALGLSRVLDTQGNLYSKGPAVQKQLAQRATKFTEAAENSYKQAQQGMAAAQQFQGLGQLARSRKAGMGNLPMPGTTKDPLQLGRAGTNLTGSAQEEGSIGPGPQSNPGSDISGSRAWDLRTGGPANAIGRADLGAALRQGAGKAGGAPKSSVPSRSLEETRARLVALGASSVKPVAPIYPAGFEPGSGPLSMAAGGQASGADRAPASLAGSTEALHSILEPAAGGAHSQIAPGSAEAPTPEVSSSAAFELEDNESLFQRVKLTHLRAAKNGLVTPVRDLDPGNAGR